ncbi:MAG: M14 family metallopeptidase [Solirubrobacterales bacterium]
MKNLMVACLATGVFLVAGQEADDAAASGFYKAGESVRDRPIVAKVLGETNAPFKVLVVGAIHGDETQGVRVVKRLRNGAKGVAFWTVRTANPDGVARGTRKNARGVDLNRNFPYRFDPALDGGYNSGPGPASEPETRAVMRLARRVDFDLAIWYHQPWGRTHVPCGKDRRWATIYARLSLLGPGGGCDRTVYPGSAVSWQHQEFGTTAFVVELTAGVQSKGTIKHHARAVVRLAKRMR